MSQFSGGEASDPTVSYILRSFGRRSDATSNGWQLGHS
jgi:hypothetical protein